MKLSECIQNILKNEEQTRAFYKDHLGMGDETAERAIAYTRTRRATKAPENLPG